MIGYTLLQMNNIKLSKKTIFNPIHIKSSLSLTLKISQGKKRCLIMNDKGDLVECPKCNQCWGSEKTSD